MNLWYLIPAASGLCYAAFQVVLKKNNPGINPDHLLLSIYFISILIVGGNMARKSFFPPTIQTETVSPERILEESTESETSQKMSPLMLVIALLSLSLLAYGGDFFAIKSNYIPSAEPAVIVGLIALASAMAAFLEFLYDGKVANAWHLAACVGVVVTALLFYKGDLAYESERESQKQEQKVGANETVPSVQAG